MSALILATACVAEGPTVVPNDSELEETFVGRADDDQTFVSIVRSGTTFMIYACDDVHHAWFRGVALASPFELTNAAGDHVLVALEDEGATGDLTLAGSETPIAFALDETEEEVLFRDDATIAGESLVGGWIRLPDGDQRGLIVRGTTGVASRIMEDGVSASGALGARLIPAAFTPRSLQAPIRTRAARFDLFALGDSYGAGEGAPEVAGDYEDNGNLEEDGDREIWNASLSPAGEREARGCHRSGISGIELAADALRADYGTAIDLRLESFACSGATTEHLTDCPYRGAVGDHFEEDELQRPQIGRLRERSAAFGADAVYMSIGGNDMRFGYLISECLAGECGEDSSIADEFSDAVGRMEDRYSVVGELLEDIVPREAVYIAGYPNPLVDEDGDTCEELDIFRFGGVGVIGAEDVAWLSDEVHATLNEQVAAGATANHWNFIDDHVETFVGHGYCTDDPWFHDNPSSLRTQGHHMSDSLRDCNFPLDMCIAPSETEEDACFPQFFLDPGRYPTVGGSIVHPTRDGYSEGYAPAIAAAMRARVEDHIRPLTTVNERIQQQARNGGVIIAWDDRSSTETEYRVRITYAEGAGLPATETIVLPADSRQVNIPLSVRARGRAFIAACFVGPRPGRREVCARERAIDWTNFAPTTVPTGVRVDTSRAATIPRERLLDSTASQVVRIVWNATGETGVVFYDVELTNSDGSVSRLATADTSFIASAQLASARVRACNFTGCSNPSVSVTGPSCPSGQVVLAAGQCAGTTRAGLSPRDLECPGLVRDPAGICPPR